MAEVIAEDLPKPPIVGVVGGVLSSPFHHGADAAGGEVNRWVGVVEVHVANVLTQVTLHGRERVRVSAFPTPARVSLLFGTRNR